MTPAASTTTAATTPATALQPTTLSCAPAASSPAPERPEPSEPSEPTNGRPEPPRDRVGAAERLCTDIEARLEQALSGATAVPSNIYVGWSAALEAAVCPVRYRASGAGGWAFPGWSPPLAAAAIGRAALAWYLQVHMTRMSTTGVADGEVPLPHPLEVVRTWIREAARAPTSSVAEWVADLARSRERPRLAAAAANATRWVAGFVRVVGWPLPDRLALIGVGPDNPFARRWTRHWRPGRGSPVTVASTPDAVVGKVVPAGPFDLLVHRMSTPTDSALVDRAAFEATAGALASRMVADDVVVTTADSGERVRVPIDETLLRRGADLVVAVVRQRVLAQDDWEHDDATPSAACHHCPEQRACGPGQAWLAGPGRWHAGLPRSATV